MKSKSGSFRKIFTLVVIPVIIVGLVGFNIALLFSSRGNQAPQNDSSSLSNNVYSGIECINPDLPLADGFPKNFELKIIISGEEEVIPAGIGVSDNCQRPIYTVDDGGAIFLVSSVAREFTLGQFFKIWGWPFSKNEVLGYRADASHSIKMTVGGAPSDMFGDLVLNGGEEIVIEYQSD